MDDGIDTVDERLDRRRPQVDLMEREPRRGAEVHEVRLLDGTRVVGDERVKADNLVTACDQPFGKVRADEASSAGDEDPHQDAKIVVRSRMTGAADGRGDTRPPGSSSTSIESIATTARPAVPTTRKRIRWSPSLSQARVKTTTDPTNLAAPRSMRMAGPPSTITST
jgi:hypothetical protein